MQKHLQFDERPAVVQIDTSINLSCVGCDGEWWGLAAIPDGWAGCIPVKDDPNDLLQWGNMIGWCPECQAREIPV